MNIRSQPLLKLVLRVSLHSGFSTEQIELQGVEASLDAAWSLDTVATRFSATLNAAGVGLLHVRVAAGAAKDDSGNPSEKPSEELLVRCRLHPTDVNRSSSPFNPVSFQFLRFILLNVVAGACRRRPDHRSGLFRGNQRVPDFNRRGAERHMEN